MAVEPKPGTPAHASARAEAPLRVLAVIPRSETSGFVFARRQVISLGEVGIRVEPFYLQGRRSLFALPAEWRRFHQVLREFDPDVVHAHYGTVTALFCALATRRRLVITYRGSDLDPVPSIRWLRSACGRLMSQLAALRASRIICVSEKLRHRLWWCRSRTTVIPSGVDRACFAPQPKADARRQLGWPESDKVVLFSTGGYPGIKRLDLAEAAVAAASRAAGEPVRLVINDGTTPPAAMPVYMNAADCLLLTSDFEGSPNVVKEALACNLPVVSVDAGDVPQRLQGVTPSAIVERNPEALGIALAQIVTLGARSNGRDATRHLDASLVAGQVAEELRRAAAGTASARALRPADVSGRL